MKDLIIQLIYNFGDIRGDNWFNQIAIVLTDFLHYCDVTYFSVGNKCRQIETIQK